MPTALMLHAENSGVGAYRIWQQAKYLKRLGWEVRRQPNQTVVMPVDTIQGKESKDPSIRRAYEKYGSWEEMATGIDLLVVQRTDTTDGLALDLAIRDMADCPIIYDVDDNLYDVSESSPSYQYWHPGSPYLELSEMFMRNVNAMTTTTPELAAEYGRFCKDIHILPNCQDPEDWAGIERPGGESAIVIGWAGSNTHYDDLEIIAQPIKRILKRHKGKVVFRVIGTLPDFLAKVKGVELRKDIVDITQWPNKLAELNFDIGLAPLVNRPFNRSKSNIKWQEYAMLEIPTIASDVGPYKSIEHGIDGILTNNDPKNWEQAIEKLIASKELRRAIGVKAKQRVLADFNISKNIGQWSDTYKRVIKQYKSVSR